MTRSLLVAVPKHVILVSTLCMLIDGREVESVFTSQILKIRGFS